MIGVAYLQRMARYNRWQNESLYGAADTLTDEERRRARGAFFGSIHATLNHILWADLVWLGRLATGFTAPTCGINGSGERVADWVALKQERAALDARIIAWTDGASETDLAGDLVWFSGAMGRELTRPRWVCFVQVFNHQTHHRGQTHAMLTAAGAKPEDTDLPFMPDAYLA